MITLTAGIFMIGTIIYKLGSMNVDALKRGAIAALGIGVAIVALQKVSSLIKGGDFKIGSLANIIAVIAGIVVLADVVVKLGQYGFTTLASGIGAVLALGIVIQGLVFIGRVLAGGEFGNSLASVTQMIGLAVSMVALTYVIQQLASMNPVAFIGAIVGMIVVFGLLVVAAKVLRNPARISIPEAPDAPSDTPEANSLPTSVPLGFH